ncbi:MAG: hypothetical protein WCK92_14790 [Bacteroidota bacterium]
MKKQNPIDDLFRSELTDYRVVPSDERRAAFMREVVGKYGKGSRPFWWIAGVVAIILIGAGIAVFVLENHSPAPAHEGSVASAMPSAPPASSTPFARSTASANTTTGTVKSNEINGNKTNTINTTHPASPNPAPGSQVPGPRTQNPVSSSPLPAPRSPLPAPRSPLPGPALAAATVPVPSTGELQANPAVTPAASKVEQPQSSLTPVASKEEQPQSSLTPAAPKPEQSRPSLTPEAPKPEASMVTPAPKAETTKSSAKPEAQNEEKKATYREKSYPPKKWNISAGAYYTPEWMFNTLNGDKFVNNFGVEGTFHFGRYSVRTGVGLSITSGSNEMLRQTNSYLGAYNALDSISFQWNQQHTSLVPTYFTQQKSVYDSTLTYNYSYNKKRYTYLQVPLILGYDFWQNNWLSLGVRGGAVMSLLVKSENLSDTYNEGNDKVITINNVSPDRIQLNWQGIGGVNATFRLSRRFSIEVEPDVRYYFNSVYESSEVTTKPWSLGVRAAIVVTW